MKILELLKNEGYTTWVQGNHTRLLISGKLYEVFTRKKGKYSRYNKLSYQGYHEEEAVICFMESENK